MSGKRPMPRPKLTFLPRGAWFVVTLLLLSTLASCRTSPNVAQSGLSDSTQVTLDIRSADVQAVNAGAVLNAVTFNAHLDPETTPSTEDRLARLPATLRSLDADFLCLQEVWDSEALDQLAKQLVDVYPHLFFVRTPPAPLSAPSLPAWQREGRSGLVLFSKYPLENRGHLPLDSSSVRRVVLAATAKVGARSLDLYCTQFSQGDSAEPYTGRHGSWEGERLSQADQTITYVQSRSPKGPALLLGDLFAGPDGPEYGATQPEVYQRFGEAGILDLFAAVAQEECTVCTGNHFRQHDSQSARPDHVMGWMTGAPPLSARVVLSQMPGTEEAAGADADEAPLSDHYGILVEIQLLTHEGGGS